MNTEHQQSVFSKFKIFNFSKNIFAFILLTTIGLTADSGAVFAVSEDSSLESIEGTSFDLFEVADDINFPTSRKVYIEAVEASFSKVWMRKFRNKTSRSYRKNTLQKFAETFHSHLSEKLANSGWIVINAPEEEAMKVSAKLLNLHINGPETVDMTNTLVLNIGKSGLELTIVDADNQLALHIKDSRVVGSLSESYFETNNGMNFIRFNKLFNGWANNFTVFLNIIAKPSSVPAPQVAS